MTQAPKYYWIKSLSDKYWGNCFSAVCICINHCCVSIHYERAAFLIKEAKMSSISRFLREEVVHWVETNEDSVK